MKTPGRSLAAVVAVIMLSWLCADWRGYCAVLVYLAAVYLLLALIHGDRDIGNW